MICDLNFCNMWRKVILLLVIQMTYNWQFTLSGPTVVPAEHFSAKADADALCKGIYSHFWGIKESEVSKVLCRRSYAQRVDIVNAYREECKDKLLAALEDKCFGDLIKLYRRLLLSPGAVMANDLKETIDGERKDYGVVTELLCGTDNIDKAHITASYSELFGLNVTDHVAEKYKNDKKEYHFALKEFCWKTYNETSVLDITKADVISAKLRTIPLKEQQQDFKLQLQSILRTYSMPDLSLIFQRYRHQASCGIEDAIDVAMKDEEAEAYSTLVRSMENRYTYYANLLHEAVDGVTTDEDRINRIVVCQCEKYLGDINDEYNRIYGKTFQECLGGWFGDASGSGDYLKALKYLLGDS